MIGQDSEIQVYVFKYTSAYFSSQYRTFTYLEIALDQAEASNVCGNPPPPPIVG